MFQDSQGYVERFCITHTPNWKGGLELLLGSMLNILITSNEQSLKRIWALSLSSQHLSKKFFSLPWKQIAPITPPPLAKRNISKCHYGERTTFLSLATGGQFRCSLVFWLKLVPGRSGKKKWKKWSFPRGNENLFCVMLWRKAGQADVVLHV